MAFKSPFRRASVGRQSFGGGEAAPKLSPTKISELYGSCIQLANANKINQKNAFQLNLIDHIKDVVQSTQDGTMDTNFVAAGCTLDASVKIYSYRVDSVHTDAFRVMGGFSRNTAEANEENDDKPADSDEENDGEGDQAEGVKTKVKKHTATTTIEQNPDNLIQKKLEEDVVADPLFKKMSAAFDQGGARGLLLNNLGVFGGCELVVDSAVAVDQSGESKRNAGLIDISTSNIHNIVKSIAPNLAKMQICPQLHDFLGGTDNSSLGLKVPTVNAVEEPVVEAPICDLDAADDDDDDDGGADMDDGLMDVGPPPEGDDGDMDGVMGVPQAAAPAGPVTDFEGSTPLGLIPSNIGEFSYYGAGQTWAGPQHWRPRFVKGAVEESKPKGAKTKEAFKLALVDAEPMDEALLGESKAATTLASTAERSSAANTLPLDLRYTPAMLTSLFLRPSLTLGAVSPDAALTFGGTGALGNGGVFDGVDALGAMQDMHDADDMDDDDMADDGMGGDWGGGALDAAVGVALLDQPRMAEKISINVCRKPKRVNVRALKENIWRSLTETEEGGLPTKMETPTSLTSVIDHVPINRFPDVSVPFCFICLLHLANEKSLKLETVPGFSDIRVTQD